MALKDLIQNFGISFLALVLFIGSFELLLLFFFNEPASCIRDDYTISPGIKQEAQQHFLKGLDAFAHDDLKNALSLFSVAADVDPLFVNALAQKAKIAFILGKYDIAQESAQKLLSVDPDDYRAFITLGNIALFDVNAVKEGFSKFDDGKSAFDYYKPFLVKAALLHARAEKLCPSTSFRPLCIFRDDPETDYSPAPGFKTIHFSKKFQYFVKINEQGFRGPSPGKKIENEVRVFFIGDSYIFGYLIPENQTIPVYLQKALTKKHPEKTITVFNLGVPGFDFVLEKPFFERYAYLKPDIVLVGVNETDILGKQKVNNCSGVTASKCLYTRGSCLNNQKPILETLFGWTKTYSFLSEKVNLIEKNNQQYQNQKITRYQLIDLIDSIRSSGAKPVIVFIPLIDVIDDTDKSNKVRAFFQKIADEKNVPFVDPSNIILKRSKTRGQDLYFRVFDTHTNSKGNEAISDAIVMDWEKIGLS